MKTIAFLSASLYHYFYPKNANKFGGVARIYRVVDWLSKRPQYCIQCVVGDFGQSRVIKLKNVSLIKCRIDKLWNVFGVYALLKNLKPDLIVDFYPTPRVFLLGILRRFSCQRFIYFTGSDIDVNGGYRSFTNPLFYWMYGWGLKQADMIVCQTDWQARLLRKKYGLKGHVILSPYIRISPIIETEKQYFLWVGRSNAYKRPDLFLRLALCMPHEEFVMICNQGQHGQDMYGEVCARAGRMANVEFIPSVSPDKMPAIYAGAKWLINTSDFEGFPNTFIEAAIQATPIVSLNVDPNGILSHFRAGVCCRGSFNRMIETCRKVAKDQKRRNELGKCAREYATVHHDIDRAMKEMVNQFEKVMGDR